MSSIKSSPANPKEPELKFGLCAMKIMSHTLFYIALLEYVCAIRTNPLMQKPGFW